MRRLLREAGSGTLLPIVLAVGAGLCQALAVVAIGVGAQALEDGPLPWAKTGLFGGVLLLLATMSALAQLSGQRLVERIAASVALRVGGGIADSELATVESMGGVQIVDTISRNASAVRRGAHALLGLIFAVVQLAGLLGTLLFYAPWTALLLGAVALIGYRVQERVRIRSSAIARRADLADTRLAMLTRHLVSGFRELVGSRLREADFVANHLMPAATDLTAQRSLAQATALLAGLATGIALTLVLISAFVAPALGLTGGVALAVFVSSHTYDGLQAVVTYLPLVSEAGQAIGRLDAIAAALRRDSKGGTTVQTRPRRFDRIEFLDVSFRYPGADAPNLGPFDLSLRNGELVFITGGNGSGKSTLMKLLTGLYPPTSGLVLIDGAIWHPEDQRSLFSAVFTDFHLFEAIPATENFDPATAEAILERLDLTEQVTVNATGFAAPRLSGARRKRLALAQALMEDRPILVLDEWTADQAPAFRAHFFETLLPSLRQDGRTIVAITHDERFFGRCDRLLHLADGRIVSDTKMPAEAVPA
ncbi:MAG: ATP-binding cassette domain-containing protein [Rhodospirillales bacterium]